MLNIYDYWFDSDGNMHEISKMDDNYINNCLRQLDRWCNSWHGIVPEQLTREELNNKDKVGTKAWFVFNGLAYVEVFCEELRNRK